MSTCRDCIHFDVCLENAKEELKSAGLNIDLENMSLPLNRCEFFKDKSKIVELLCKVGDVVYTLDYDDNEPYDYTGWILLMANDDFALLSPTINGENNPTELCNIFYQRYVDDFMEGCNSCVIVPISDLYFSIEEAEKALEKLKE